MLIRFFSLLIIVLLCNDVAHAKNIRRNEVEDLSVPANSYDATDYDYDYDGALRMFPSTEHRQNSNPTTPRPLLSYLQNFMRNVRLPVPYISWNVTTPLANLFNIDDETPLDTPHAEEDSQQLNSQQDHRQKQRRKKTNRKRNQKYTYPIEYAEQEQQMPLNNMDPGAAVYFYDPSTDAYYSVQRINAMGSYIGSSYNPEQTVETARGRRKQKVPITVPFDDESSNVDDAQTEISLEDETESDINLDEVEEIDLAQNSEYVSPKQQKKSKNVFLNEEAQRDVLGSSRIDKHFNRQRQHTKDQHRESIEHQQQPRSKRIYFLLLNWN